MYIRKNNPPVNGSCLVSPTYGVSLVDKFFVLCDGWEDPEEMSIKQYLIISKLVFGSGYIVQVNSEYGEEKEKELISKINALTN